MFIIACFGLGYVKLIRLYTRPIPNLAFWEGHCAKIELNTRIEAGGPLSFTWIGARIPDLGSRNTAFQLVFAFKSDCRCQRVNFWSSRVGSANYWEILVEISSETPNWLFKLNLPILKDRFNIFWSDPLPHNKKITKKERRLISFNFLLLLKIFIRILTKHFERVELGKYEKTYTTIL